MRPVLVVGLPRSGTTWVGRCLGLAESAWYVNEPDNENVHPFAVRAKHQLGRYPILGPRDSSPTDYERLWSASLAGARQPDGPAGRLAYRLHQRVRRQAHPEGLGELGRLGRVRLAAGVALASPGRVVPSDHVVVKSVFIPFALEWLTTRWDPQFVVVLRDPLNTISSWWRLGWRDIFRHHPDFAAGSTAVPRRLAERLDAEVAPLQTGASALQRLSWQFGLLTTALLSACRQHPEWLIVRHDDLCRHPAAGFRELYAEAGLDWSVDAEAFLVRSNRPGKGAFDTTRVASQEDQRWRERLSDAEVSDVQQILTGFTLTR